MNKTELVDAIAAGADISKATAAKALDAAVDAITNAVANGDQVTLVGFGSFKASARAARVGKNPKTGAALDIAATTVPKFTAGTAFKAAVAKKK
jgi:DNA-binding protein HU-beta